MSWFPWKWRSERRAARERGEQVTRDAIASRLQAEADWMEAVKRRPEAARLTETLAEHNSANRYDDWLLGIVRR